MSKRLARWKVEALEPRKRCNAIWVVRAKDEEHARAAFYRAGKKIKTPYGVITEAWPIISIQRIDE